jgi:PAS domain S-box-containing protein
MKTGTNKSGSTRNRRNTHNKVLLDSIFNTIQDLILIVDKDLRILMSNWKSPGYTGDTKDPGNPHCYEAFIHRDAPCESCQALESFATGKAVQAEHFNPFTKQYSEVRAYPLFDDSNKVIMVVEHVRDITDRTQAEKALRESKERYHLLFEEAQDGIALADAETGEIVDCNQALCRMTERDKSELLGQPQRILHPQHQLENEHSSSFLSHKTGDPGQPLEDNLLSKSGKMIPVEIRASRVQMNGRDYLHGIFRDITERKQAEEALLESEKRYREFFATSHDCVFITTMKGQWIDFNDAALDMFGYDRRMELSQVPISSLYVSQEERSALLSLIEKQGYVKEQPVRLRRRDGAIINALITAVFRQNADGSGREYYGTIRDITERKRSEEALKESENKYRLLADNVDDVIFVLDMNLNYTYVSPSVKMLRGYEPAEVLKQPSIETLTPSSWDLAMRTLAEIIDLEKSGRRDVPISQTLQLEMMRKNGTAVWTEVKFSFIRDEDQQLVGILGVTRDITERKQAEEELLNTLKQLRETKDFLIQSEKLAAMGQLSAGVAHEILNPINIISMKIQLMDMTETLTDEAKADLLVCKEQIAKVANITKGMSQFARVSGKQIVPCDLNQLTDHVLTLIAPRLRVENVGTAIQYQPDLPLIQMDKDKMEQVILNVISNALDAMHNKEEKTLRISTEFKGANVVGLVISDNGTGIAPEILNKIFDPFFTTKESGEGTGLGLSISYGIIRDHAGNIWSEGNEWGGTSFFIELPIKYDTAKN